MGNKIMKALTQLFNILSCIILITSTGCSHKMYVDTTGEQIKIDDGYLASYTDSNVFVFKTKVYGTRDTEKIYPKFFEISLPKNIKYFRFMGQNEFEFYYSKKQVIYIKIDLEDKGMNKIDTVYSLSRNETYDLIHFDEYSRSDTSKYILQRISFKKSRKTTVVKKGAATILLYNIVPEKNPKFLDLVKQFKFLPRQN